MNDFTLLGVAAALLVATGLAHSYLGERYLLIRLFRRPDLPKLFGSSDFTVRTLRFAWHLTSLAWWGYAALLLMAAEAPLPREALGWVVGAVFGAHFLIALVGSKARHLSWLAFGAVTVCAVVALT